MHESSRLKFEAFMYTYVQTADDLNTRSVLDVGSRQTNEKSPSYRKDFDALCVKYSGIDLEAGFNVDIVPANPYVWDEIANETFDYVISGQAFEHNPFMWVTAAEIARVLKPGGMAFIIAPSAGKVHRYPFDCWRYYPDSWAALAAITQLELVESLREPAELMERISGGRWVDSAAILRKPLSPSKSAKKDFYDNLAMLTAPLKKRRYEVVPAVINEGPAFARYFEVAMGMAPIDRAAKLAARIAKRRAARGVVKAAGAGPAKSGPAKSRPGKPRPAKLQAGKPLLNNKKRAERIAARQEARKKRHGV